MLFSFVYPPVCRPELIIQKITFFHVWAATHPCMLPRHESKETSDTSVLLENTPLVKFMRKYIRDPRGVFSISSLVGILKKSFPAFSVVCENSR